MKNLNDTYSLLKRFLKRKTKITEALLVVFLITGGVGFAYSPDTYSPDEHLVLEAFNPHGIHLVNGNAETGETIDSTHGNWLENVGLIKGTTKAGTLSTHGGKVINTGTIDSSNTGAGMVALGIGRMDNSLAWNRGIIENTGDYGILAVNGGIGINTAGDWETTQTTTGNPPTKIQTTFGKGHGIKNDGNYGMAAYANHTAIDYDKYEDNDERRPQPPSQKPYSALYNSGLVANTGDYGMYVEADGTNVVGPPPTYTGNNNNNVTPMAFGVNTGGILNETHVYAKDEHDGGPGGREGRPDEVKKYNTDTYKTDGGVKNGGDNGMVANAQNGGIAGQLNFGLVANGGNNGMVANAEVGDNGNPTVAFVGNFGGTGEFTYSQTDYEFQHGNSSNNTRPAPPQGNIVGNLNESYEVSTENGVKNGGDYGMVASAKGEGAIALAANAPYIPLLGMVGQVNNGGNGEDEGCDAPDVLEPLGLPSMGLVANGGNVGMGAYAVEGGVAIAVNAGFDADYNIEWREEYNNGHRNRPHGPLYSEFASSGSAIGGVQNSGNYGMVAQSDVDSVAVVANLGLVANGGDYGMVADGQEAWAINAAGDMDLSLAYGNPDGNLIHRPRNGGPESPLPDYVDLTLSTTGGVQNGGNVGMAAYNGGAAVNLGLVANGGDIGMIADGTAVVGDGTERSYAVNTGRDLSVEGSIIGVREEDRNSQNNYVPEANLSLLAAGGVRNDGNIGMAATNGGLAVNTGLVANNGDVGMIATGTGSDVVNHQSILGAILAAHADEDGILRVEGEIPAELLENLIHFPDRGYDYTGSLAVGLGDYGVRNNGNFGMAAENGGMALNAGLVKNTGDVGMVAYDNSLAINWGRDLSTVDLLNTINGGENMPGIVDGILKGIVNLHGGYLADFVGSGSTDFLGWIETYGGLTDAEKADITTKYSKDILKGGIVNDGNIGAYVAGNSAFVNHGIIDPQGTNPITDAGKAILSANGLDPNSTEKIAIIAGAGDNTIYLGSGSEITGRVNGGGGDNTLYFIDSVDPHTGKVLQDKQYGKIDDYSFSHIVFAKNGVRNEAIDGSGEILKDVDGTIYDKGDGVSEATWKVDQGIKLKPHSQNIINDYSVNGDNVITTDKFNSIYVDGEHIGRDKESSNDLFKGNVEFTKDGSLLKHVGRNVTSTLAANSISLDKGSKITQRAMDNTFTTNAKRIEITNIFTNGAPSEVTKVVDQSGLVIDGTQMGSGTLSEEYFAAQGITGGQIEGWTSRHEYDAQTGDVTLIFERAGGNGLQGGYAQSIDRYTQSNVDIINANHMRNQGYNYARKAAFLAPEKTVVQEEIIFPVPLLDKATPMKATSSKEIVAVPEPVVQYAEVINETVYNNLQFAEVFGDFGKYDGGSSSEFDYDTWGVTGATFHRFDSNWLAGISYGYAGSDVDYKTGEGGKEDVDSLGIDGFVTYQKDSWLLTGNLGYSWSKHDLTRKVFDRDHVVLGTAPVQSLTSDFDSHLISLGAELGYQYKFDDTSSLYPYVGLDYMWYTRDAYKEDGDSAYALDLDKADLNTLVSKLGLMYEKTWDKFGMFGDIGWQHYFDDPSSFNATFYKGSPASYEIPGLDIGKDVGYVKVGATYDFSEQLTGGIDYTGAFRDSETSNRVGVNVVYKW